MKKPLNLLMICLLSVVTTTGFAQPDDEEELEDATFTFVDGSNNTYTITQEEINYDPITPEESSSGEYSGGDPAKAKVKMREFEALIEIISEAMAATDQHAASREMGTAIVSKVVEGEKTSVMLKRGSKMSKRIKEFLDEMIADGSGDDDAGNDGDKDGNE